MKKLISILFLTCCAGMAQYSYPPAMMYFSPANGTGAQQSFYFTGWDYTSGSNIKDLWLRFGEVLANGCNIRFDVPANKVYLLADDGVTWGAGNTIGQVTTVTSLDNSQCGFEINSTAKNVSGNYATGYVAVYFKSSFAGPRTMYGYVSNLQGLNSGWIPVGNPATWTVPGPRPQTNITLTPPSGSGTTQTFTAQFTDYAGTSNVDYVEFFIGGWSPGCVALVYPRWNAVFLINDANTSWGTAATIGSNTVLENSFCKVNVNAVSLYYITAVKLGVNLSVTAKPFFAGNGTTALVINGLNGQTTGYVSTGTWTVPPVLMEGVFNILPVVSGVMVLDDYTGGTAMSTTSAGTDAAPMALKLKDRTVQIARAGNIKVNRADYSHKAAGDARTYTYSLDIRQVKKIRLGASWNTRYAVGDDPDIPYSKPQVTGPAGWSGSGVGWVALDGAESGDNAQFTVTSQYLPGPMALYLMDKHWMDGAPLDGGPEDVLIVQAAGFMQNSLRKMVIGPAIPPDVDKEYLDWLIDRWIKDYQLDWLKPLLDGKTVDDIQAPDGKFAAEVLACIRAAVAILPKQ